MLSFSSSTNTERILQHYLISLLKERRRKTQRCWGGDDYHPQSKQKYLLMEIRQLGHISQVSSC